MKTKLPIITALLLGLCLAAAGQEPATKVGIINIENALVSTAAGRQALEQLQAKFDPTSQQLAKMNDEIAALQEELNKGSNTMGDDRRRDLTRSIDEKTRALNRATEDAQLSVQQEQDKILQVLGQNMMSVISKYAAETGYSLILDVSNPQTPVLFASNGIEITQDIIRLYDEQYPVSAPESASTTSTPGE